MKAAVEDRVIGRFGSSNSGPLVVVIGGLHGNEPAGVIASRQVLERLDQATPRFSGQLLALAGNKSALRCGKRYVAEDLNRIWLRKWFDDRASSPEAGERSELLDAIHAVLTGFGGTAFFLDLHTTSAPGAPFSVLADTLSNRELGQRLPGAMVLGLEEHLDGTLLNYINELGHVAVGFEGGQHESPTAIEVHELAIWRTLVVAGCVRSADLPVACESAAAGSLGVAGPPRVVEVRYRYDITAEDSFRMNPGFDNLQPIVAGQVLARDRHGDVCAREGGRILMPLYQSQGTDGFFIVREISSFWLAVAAWMRRFGLDRLLPVLPGVHRHPVHEDTFVIDRRVARWFVLELCHLLGFRRERIDQDRLVVSRRKEVPVRVA